MIKLSSLVIVILLLLSCDSNVVFKDFNTDLKDNRWLNDNLIQFDFKIESSAKYDIAIHLGHIHNFQETVVPVEVAITFPDGHTEIESVFLKIKNSEGKDVANCLGDICDLYQNFKSNITLEKGNYVVTITNKSQGIYVPNVLGVGIRVNSINK